jgi:multidrug efflux pump subunit AcrB
VLEIDAKRLAAYGLDAVAVHAAIERWTSPESLVGDGTDPQAVMALDLGGPRGGDVMRSFEELDRSCSVTGIAGRPATAVQVRYRVERGRAETLAGAVASLRRELPPGVSLASEPFGDDADSRPPRVRLRAPVIAELADLVRRTGVDTGSAWLVVDTREHEARLVGLASVDDARKAAERLSATPGVEAIADVEPWSAVAAPRGRAGALATALRERGIAAWPVVGEDAPRVDVAIDRLRAAEAGVRFDDIVDTIALHGDDGLVLGRRVDAPEQAVILRVGPPEARRPPWSDVTVAAAQGRVPLASLVEVTRRAAPAVLERCNRTPCAVVDVPASAAGSLDLAALARELELPGGESLQLLPPLP